MKKLLYTPILLLTLIIVSCGGSGEASNDANTEGKITVKNAIEFADLLESIVDTVYRGFNIIEDLDGADVPESEFLKGISTLESEISSAKKKLKSIELFGENPTPLMDAANKCLVASKKLLSFLKKNAKLLSRPDNEWSDSEFESFDKMHTKFNEGLENAMDKLFEVSNDYLDSQPAKTNT